MNKDRMDVILNVPNAISVSRMLFIPVFIYLIVTGKMSGAFIIFLIAACSDFLDGMAARLLNQKTKLGTFLDPMGDKALLTTAYIILTFPKFNFPNVIPVWLTTVVIGRDLLILAGSIYAFKHLGRKSFPPILMGKISTISQMGVPLLVLYLNSIDSTTPYLLWLYLLTMLVTLVSGIKYVRIGSKWASEAKK
jgi:cardiolipin synthase